MSQRGKKKYPKSNCKQHTVPSRLRDRLERKQ